MLGNDIAALSTEIESLEGQIGPLVKQIDDIKKPLSEKNSALGQLVSERQGIENSIKALGIFNFKERKPLKEQLAANVAKIKENENLVKELQNKLDTLIQQDNELKRKIKTAQQEKERLEKEQKLKELAEQGDAQAQFDLAKLYIEAKNLTQALDWLKKAAKQGHGEAMILASEIEADQERIRLASYDLTLW